MWARAGERGQRNDCYSNSIKLLAGAHELGFCLVALISIYLANKCDSPLTASSWESAPGGPCARENEVTGPNALGLKNWRRMLGGIMTFSLLHPVLCFPHLRLLGWGVGCTTATPIVMFRRGGGGGREGGREEGRVRGREM